MSGLVAGARARMERLAALPVVPPIANVEGASLGGLATSGTVTVGGRDDLIWPIAVRGDGNPELQVSGGAWSRDGIIVAGDTVRLRLTASPIGLTARTATLRTQGLSRPWVVTSATAPWLPSDLGSLSVWLDSSDSSTIITDVSGIVEWRDKSANARHAARIDTSTAPAVAVGGINFASARRLRCTTGTFAAPLTVLLVGRSPAASYARAFSGRSDGDTRLFIGVGDTAHLAAFHGNASVGWFSVTSSTPNRAVSSQCILGASISSTALTPVHNGDTLTPITGAMDDFTGFRLGEFASQWWEGIISEVIIWANASTDDREKAEGYFAHKWGLTGSLPAGHPYKSAPP